MTNEVVVEKVAWILAQGWYFPDKSSPCDRLYMRFSYSSDWVTVHSRMISKSSIALHRECRSQTYFPWYLSKVKDMCMNSKVFTMHHSQYIITINHHGNSLQQWITMTIELSANNLTIHCITSQWNFFWKTDKKKKAKTHNIKYKDSRIFMFRMFVGIVSSSLTK